MRVTFLGTGSTSAPPLYGCQCSVCVAARFNLELRRRPASVLVEAGDLRMVIDAGLMDLADRFPSGSLAAILLTHFHPDHVQGLFQLRWGVGMSLDVFCPPDSDGCADLYKNPGILYFRQVKKFDPFHIGSVRVTPVPLVHSKVTWGYCLEHEGSRLAYLTDTVGLPPKTLEFLVDWKPTMLVLDCSYPPRSEPSDHHNDFSQAMECIRAIGPQHAWLTHIGHELDIWLNERGDKLPPNVAVSRDGMVIHDTQTVTSES